MKFKGEVILGFGVTRDTIMAIELSLDSEYRITVNASKRTF